LSVFIRMLAEAAGLAPSLTQRSPIFPQIG
jgi:hypothetical protein